MKKYEAAIFDWAGTMIDFGSFAPMGAFVEVFSEFGIDITIEQARAPMGMAKRDHIETILNMPSVSHKFKHVYGHSFTQADVDRVYEVFVPLNEKVAAKYADLIPGAAEMIINLRNRGMKIGSTTGYTRSIMEHVLPVAAKQGYSPDNLVCSDEVSKGRPAPHAMRKCFKELEIENPELVIKVDDTEPGIGEGVSVGCLTVGVSLSGNFAGKTPQELANMNEEEINEIRLLATEKLKAAGADYVIDTVEKLPALLDQLEKKLD